MPRVSLADVEVVLPSLNRRYSGVTSTVVALVPAQAETRAVAVLGPNLPLSFPRIRWRELLAGGWAPPRGRRHRVWHARRNIEMLAGVLLRDGLRQPWKLVFTSAAQRRHSRWTRFLIRRMDAVIATSPEASAYLTVPHVVSLHGVDTLRFHPVNDARRLPGDLFAGRTVPRHLAGIFGRVRHQKGTDLFVDALIRLLPERPDWGALVIGLEKPGERPYADALRTRLAEAGLDQRVRFVGEQPLDSIPTLMRALDLVVAPPRHEGFGLLPLEAQASGVPVVASRVGAHMHLIENGVTGRLVAPDDADALAAAMAAVMDLAPEERTAMGAAGRRRVEAAFSIAREAERIDGVYARLLADPPAEPR